MEKMCVKNHLKILIRNESKTTALIKKKHSYKKSAHKNPHTQEGPMPSNGPIKPNDPPSHTNQPTRYRLIKLIMSDDFTMGSKYPDNPWSSVVLLKTNDLQMIWRCVID